MFGAALEQISRPMTSAPAAASAAQIARPIPRAAPVTSADFPSKLKATCGVLSPTSAFASPGADIARAAADAPTNAPADVASIFRRDIARGLVLAADDELCVFILKKRSAKEHRF